MNDESLSAIADEIERQNAQFEDVKKTAAALGDLQFEVPTAFFDELEEVADPRAPAFTMPANALRV